MEWPMRLLRPLAAVVLMWGASALAQPASKPKEEPQKVAPPEGGRKPDGKAPAPSTEDQEVIENLELLENLEQSGDLDLLRDLATDDDDDDK